MRRLYADHCKTFIEDCERNQIAEKLRQSFKDMRGREPGQSELQSWRNSLRTLAMIFSRAGLMNQGVMLEFELPMSKQSLNDASQRGAVIAHGKSAA